MFSKVKTTNGRVHIYFCGIKVFSYKDKKKFDEVMKYISKYRYILNTSTNTVSKIGGDRCIWQLWLQGEENAPEIVKICMDSVKRYSGGRKVVVITRENLKDYVDIPHFIYDKHNRGIISYAQFSDIIRVYLLSKYGGTWIDSTIMLTGPIPEVIISSNSFVFRNIHWLKENRIDADITERTKNV